MRHDGFGNHRNDTCVDGRRSDQDRATAEGWHIPCYSIVISRNGFASVVWTAMDKLVDRGASYCDEICCAGIQLRPNQRGGMPDDHHAGVDPPIAKRSYTCIPLQSCWTHLLLIAPAE